MYRWPYTCLNATTTTSPMTSWSPFVCYNCHYYSYYCYYNYYYCYGNYCYYLPQLPTAIMTAKMTTSTTTRSNSCIDSLVKMTSSCVTNTHTVQLPQHNNTCNTTPATLSTLSISWRAIIILNSVTIITWFQFLFLLNKSYGSWI